MERRAVRHRDPGIQAVRQADGGHRQKGPCWAERVRARSEAHHAEEPEADFDAFHDRNGRLKSVFSDQVAERHLQGHAGDQQPGDTEGGRKAKCQEDRGDNDRRHQEGPE